MASIEIRGVGKTYFGGVTAVSGVDLTVKDGQLLVLVGPSGCGKSTLLRMVAGLETITQGEIAIGDKVVNKLEPAERDIAMVFQNYALYPHMSVRGNLEYGLKNRGTPRAVIAERVAEAARILEIEALLERRPRQLSGGQRQRVAMGRAIVRHPKAFLFDEPLSNLDAKLRGQMRVEIKRLQRSLGTTSIYVTHDQLEAMTLADVLVVMNAGRIEQIGAPLELYERPASLFVAGFIGAPPMNLLPVGAGQALRLEAGGGGLSGTSPFPDRRLVLGLRPEALRLAGGDGAVQDGTVRLDFTIDAVEPIGSESHIHGTLSGGGPAITVCAQGKVAFEPGSPASATAGADAVHWFDTDTGRRIEA